MQPRCRNRNPCRSLMCPADIADRQDHVGGVASLASGFGILLGKQRPQPVLVVAVSFFDAGGGASIALVARRAAELVGIVHLQQFRVGMAGEGVGILVGLLLALEVMTAAVILSGSRASMWQDSQRSTMLASATLICTILGSQSSVFFCRPSICVGREVHHVVGHVRRPSALLASVTGFSTSPSSALSLVRSVFERRCRSLRVAGSCIAALWPSGNSTVACFCLVLVNILLLALLAGGAGFGFKFVGERIDVGAAVGEDVLDGQNLCAQIGDLFLQFVAAGLGGFVGVLVGLFQFLVLRILLDVFLRLRRLRLRACSGRRCSGLSIPAGRPSMGAARRIRPTRPRTASPSGSSWR